MVVAVFDNISYSDLLITLSSIEAIIFVFVYIVLSAIYIIKRRTNAKRVQTCIRRIQKHLYNLTSAIGAMHIHLGLKSLSTRAGGAATSFVL